MDDESDTEISPGTHSEKRSPANPTGHVPLSQRGLPLQGANVSGHTWRRPGDRLYGTLTLTLYYADRMDMIDYNVGDISETGRLAICDCLDRIAGVLYTESGTISSTIPYRVPECHEAPSDPERQEDNGGSGRRPVQKSLWDVLPPEQSTTSLSAESTPTDMAE